MVDLQATLETELFIKKVRSDPAVQKEFEKWLTPKKGPGAMEAAMGTKQSKDLIKELIELVIGIEALKKVMQIMERNSKILGMITQTIARALGLLVDVVLLPFIGLIVWVLVGLFRAIMHLYTTLQDLKKIGPINLIFKIWGEMLGDAFKDLLPIAKAIWEAGGTLSGKINLDVISGVVTGFLKWVYENLYNLGEAIVVPIEFLASKVSEFIVWVWQMILEIGNTIKLNFDSGIIAKFVQDMINFATNGLNIAVNFVGGIGSSIQGGLESGVNSIGTTLGIPRDVPSGGMTVNISGQFKSDEEMYRKFVDKLRGEQWRTNV